MAKKSAGYIAWFTSADGIHATGKTAAEAKKTIREQLGDARQYREWVKEGVIQTTKATQRLIESVEEYGGSDLIHHRDWEEVDGVADLTE